MKIDVDQIKNNSSGRWKGILDGLGIDVGTGEHRFCPICSSGDPDSDRFRFDDNGKGSWFCNQCSPKAGDGFGLVMKFFNIPFLDAVVKVSEIIGSGIPVSMGKQKPSFDVKKALNELWTASKPLAGSDIASRYLHARGIVLTPDNVRYNETCWESSTKTKMPAMISRFTDVNGKPISLHRTYLAGDKKADIKSPRKMFTPLEPLSGGAIRLFKSQNNTLGIAEGIETAIAAKQITQIPTWAAVSSTLLKAFQPPDEIRRLVIFADADANFCGQQAAYTLANRLQGKDIIIEVELPEIGKDFNDCLQDRATR